MADNTIKLELSVEECNTILRVLGKHPFEEVVTLINNIKQQGEPQVAAMAPKEEAPAEAPAAE
jgi:hypothetical protein